MLVVLAAAAAARSVRTSARALVHMSAGELSKLNDQAVAYKLTKTDDEWRAQLSPQQFNILRQKGTEYPGSGEYNKFAPPDGHFVCAGCATPLYSAAAKFDSGCGWPAFDSIVGDNVVTKTDNSLGMSRVEIMCAGCGGHLGHVFEGERFTPTNERHCVNSVSIKYVDGPLPADLSERKVLPKRDGGKQGGGGGLFGGLFG